MNRVLCVSGVIVVAVLAGTITFVAPSQAAPVPKVLICGSEDCHPSPSGFYNVSTGKYYEFGVGTGEGPNRQFTPCTPTAWGSDGPLNAGKEFINNNNPRPTCPPSTVDPESFFAIRVRTTATFPCDSSWCAADKTNRQCHAKNFGGPEPGTFDDENPVLACCQ